MSTKYRMSVWVMELLWMDIISYLSYIEYTLGTSKVEFGCPICITCVVLDGYNEYYSGKANLIDMDFCKLINCIFASCGILGIFVGEK